ncbi:MAG: D-alanyl-D-alanine carboxypeptidase [Flaviaesturariibacter sp.]|nr:D-alanyl-D-alanine carboxypeptidase [Flaviaesturariibacter sp.]
MPDMKRYSFLFSTLLSATAALAQPTSARLATAFARFEADSQLRSAISSLYVIDGRTGVVVFEKNAMTGLATASTLKVVTAASAYELLGTDFRYRTSIGTIGRGPGSILYLKPSGDPSLGSWRWPGTTDSTVLAAFTASWRQAGVRPASLMIDDRGWEGERIPDGWMWQDIGNYYGAGASAFNWRENQFDILLKSGPAIGSPVSIASTRPRLRTLGLRSVATAAAKGSGDQSYVYYPLTMDSGIVRGTIPVGETSFTISAALPNPEREFAGLLGIPSHPVKRDRKITGDTTILYTHVSPPLDSLVYWFLRRSINLYGEALARTIGYNRTGVGTTDEGTKQMQRFWKERGIDPVELKMEDGSGLSPLNRVTTHAQVQVLRYAQSRPWFNGYYAGFPEYNGMKMKSGTINGVKGFCGYHVASDGTPYIFSFLVNNYNGSASLLVKKMYAVLDLLK